MACPFEVDAPKSPPSKIKVENDCREFKLICAVPKSASETSQRIDVVFVESTDWPEFGWRPEYGTPPLLGMLTCKCLI